MMKKQVMMNRPTIVGATILDRSKWWMHTFYHETLVPFFGKENIQTCYTDTDSLVFKVRSPDPSRPDMPLAEILARFQYATGSLDLSETKPAMLSEMREHYASIPGVTDELPLHQMILGKFKDEAKDPILEWIALRSKSYSYIKSTGDEVKRTKGIRKDATVERGMHDQLMAEAEAEDKNLDGAEKEFFVKRRKLNHTDFQSVMAEGWDAHQPVEFTVLRANAGRKRTVDDTRAWEMRTLGIKRQGLNRLDTKSHYNDAEDCLRYGHYRIREEKEMLECILDRGFMLED